MKRIHTLLFIVIAIVVGCQSSIVDFVDRTPDVSTGEVLEIGSTSVVLSGSFRPRSSVNIYDAVYCFCVYNHEDYLQNYYFDSFDYDDVVTKTIEISGLQSNTTYYYKFGAVHGTLNGDGSVDRLSPSEVWGEEKSFVTREKVVPNIMSISYSDIFSSSDYLFLQDGVVTYDVTVELDSPLTEYVDPDCTECGFYVTSGLYSHYSYETSILGSGKILRCLLSFDKKDYTISYSPTGCFAITSECNVGLYVIKDGNREIFAEMPFPGFEYTRQPKITISNLFIGTVSEISHVNEYYNRQVPYGYDIQIEGALFINTIALLYYGLGEDSDEEYYVEPASQRDTKFLLDDIIEGDRSMFSHMYFSDNSAGIRYIEYYAGIGDGGITSDTSIKFVYDGRGNVDISLSSDGPGTY